MVPEPGNPQTLDRYTYVLNNPFRYRDPTGNWVETIADAAFIAYDIHQIWKEGLTFENSAALAADVACALLPVATGGGPTMRLALAGGGEAVQASVQSAELARIAARGIQTWYKIQQAATGNGESEVPSPSQDSWTPKSLDSLSQAAEYGIETYAEQRKHTGQGTGLVAHHLTEKRLAQIIGKHPDDIPSIVLIGKEHGDFTNAWRSAIGYDRDRRLLRTSNATASDVLNAMSEVYGEYPDILGYLTDWWTREGIR